MSSWQYSIVVIEEQTFLGQTVVHLPRNGYEEIKDRFDEIGKQA